MYVLGTAGHVDHGKSTLIERLTGIDPDRLAEEKARGLTIDLGFAWLTLPSGREIGIVDVPGHERFVHNMLAGAGSIDATVFVVAANEGWKPQSEEHLAILDLLGVRGGVVALTKRDLVDDEALSEVAEAIRGRLADTVLQDAPVVPVSPVTGDGIDDLVGAIEGMLDRTPPSPDLDRPRLFVDRSFSIKGAGTVVTGTLTGGRLSVDDEIDVLPSGARGRIRSIQTHKKTRAEAEPGSRVALNLAGLDRHEIQRGDAVVRPGRWRPSDLLDVWMQPVRTLDHAVPSRGSYKLHLGSVEVDARLVFLNDRLRPGGTAYARIQLGGAVVADAFDRFVLRDPARGETMAGGVVLDAHPIATRLTVAARATRAKELEARRAAGREGLAAMIVTERGAVEARDLAWLAGSAGSGAGPLRGYAVSNDWLDRATGDLSRVLDEFHREHPLAAGMSREDARAEAKIRDPKLFAALVEAQPERFVGEGPLLRLATHRVSLSPEQQAERDRLMTTLDGAGLAPPSLADLTRTFGAPLVGALLDAGDLVKIASDFALARERYDEVRRTIADAVTTEGPLTASRIREILGSSRKYVIPLLEHLDAAGFTKRRGDVRVLADPP